MWPTRPGRWYDARVQREVWARLTSPFPSEALAWNVARLLVEGDSVRAQLEPCWAPDAVRARLDQQLGLDGWSYSLSAAGEAGVVCSLTVAGVTRSAAAGGLKSGVPLEQVAQLAFSRCARQFGIAPLLAPQHDSYWVEFDPDSNEPLFLPDGVPLDAGLQAPQAPGAEPVEAPAAARDASSEALAMIEKLVDRLKEKGMGREAAKLVARHHDGSADGARELYGRLRALLLNSEQEE